MIVVLDASAAIEMVFQRESANKLEKIIKEADWVIAPNLFICEVSNTVWKYHKFADMPFKDCETSLQYIIALPDNFINEKEFFLEAFKLSCSSNHSVYDMLYLVLARRNNGLLLTMDNKLKKIANHYSIEVN